MKEFVAFVINRGDKFLCTQDVIMDDGELSYKKGGIYTSECDGCITNLQGDKNHEWKGVNYFNDYFKKVESMAGIDKLKTSYYGDYNALRLWCVKNNPELLYSFYEPFLSYDEWEKQQKLQRKKIGDKDKVINITTTIANFLSHEDKYLYWHCPLEFVREYLETQCGYKKANWFVKLFWRK